MLDNLIFEAIDVDFLRTFYQETSEEQTWIFLKKFFFKVQQINEPTGFKRRLILK